MTTSEAKEKLCPIIRAPYKGEGVSMDKFGFGLPCVADKCMAWRWNNKTQNEGYCGLAGKI